MFLCGFHPILSVIHGSDTELGDFLIYNLYDFFKVTNPSMVSQTLDHVGERGISSSLCH